MFLNLKNFCLRSYVYDNQAKAFFWNIYRYSHSFITDILNNSIHDKILKTRKKTLCTKGALVMAFLIC